MSNPVNPGGTVGSFTAMLPTMSALNALTQQGRGSSVTEQIVSMPANPVTTKATPTGWPSAVKKALAQLKPNIDKKCSGLSLNSTNRPQR